MAGKYAITQWREAPYEENLNPRVQFGIGRAYYTSAVITEPQTHPGLVGAITFDVAGPLQLAAYPRRQTTRGIPGNGRIYG